MGKLVQNAVNISGLQLAKNVCVKVVKAVAMLSKWDERFIELARLVAAWSKDPSTKVGAVIVRPDRTIASLGFNGFARGVDDTEERLNNRELKYPLTIHAEANALMSANEKLNGCTLYVTPLLPCHACAGLIIQSGISKVVAECGIVNNPDLWHSSFAIAKKQFEEAGVEIIFKNLLTA